MDEKTLAKWASEWFPQGSYVSALSLAVHEGHTLTPSELFHLRMAYEGWYAARLGPTSFTAAIGVSSSEAFTVVPPRDVR
jgi:hypothetical protein